MKYIVTILSVLIVAAVVTIVLLLNKSAPIAYQYLPSQAYLESPGNFEGNSYQINASINSQVTSNNGNRLYLIQDVTTNTPLSVIVSDSFNTTLYPNQRYTIDITVQNKNLVVTKITKL